MNYWNYKIRIQPRDPWVEILIAQLSGHDFDSFQETDDGVEAYISEVDSSESTEGIIKGFAQSNELQLSFEKELVKLKNWNEEWENAFEPVVVGGFCVIKAPFHDVTVKCEHELIIMPKMSFGTGHHPTTHLMVNAMKFLEFKNKVVLDMGSGTGVLGILACKLQAEDVLGIDIDQWAVENAIENSKANNCQMKFEFGGKEKIPAKGFDVVLANINRNILLDQKEDYKEALIKNGILLISGFLKQDKKFLEKEFKNQGFEHINGYEKENWVCLVFQKK
ncbi:MAG: ribosomal protein L11 methyltransferase [Saprospiraceae bacterium]|jgi:ribosomal protein L11 methyltransferase